MTRNEAIFLLGKLEEVLKKSHMDSEAEAVALGIYAIGTEEELRKERDAALDLKNESSETRKELDCISREAAIDALGERPIVWTDDNLYALGERNQYDIDRLAIETVPSAQPERKTGFWYALEKGDKGYSAGDFKCSVCGEPNHTWLPKPNFCPNCGADMREQP